MTVREVRYNYRLRVSEAQARALQGVFDAGRFVWNTALGRWNDLWRYEQTSLSYADAARELTDWRSRFEWLSAQPQNPQEQVVRDLCRAVAAFFDKKNPAGRPRFKKKGHHATARWTTNGFSLRDGRLLVAVADRRIALRVVWSRELPSPPTSVTVCRDGLGLFVASFVVRIEVPDGRLPTGRATGLDLGLRRFATTEDPEGDIANPRHLRHAQKALKRSQRSVARKKPGSAGRTRAKRRLARRQAKVAASRRDFQHKAARSLVATFDVIGVEDLRVKNLMRRGRKGHRRRKAGLNRSLADASFGQFVAILEHQASKVGAEVVRLPAAYTTQRCSGCGSIAKTRVELRDRVFRCEECGLELDRDRNAARNLNPVRATRSPAGLTSGWGDDGGKTGVPEGTRAA